MVVECEVPVEEGFFVRCLLSRRKGSRNQQRGEGESEEQPYPHGALALEGAASGGLDGRRVPGEAMKRGTNYPHAPRAVSWPFAMSSWLERTYSTRTTPGCGG